MSNDFFFTIKVTVTAEYKDRGSKFIAYAYPLQSVDEFKIYLKALKKEHPKAVHYCFAYRFGTDTRPTGSSGRGNNFRVSDDGEPSGTAGRPILGQIDSKELTNILIIVVRYFGGALLGVPGLINAYKTASALALQPNLIIQRPVHINYRLQFDYTQMNDVMKLVKQFDCRILKHDPDSYREQLFCSLEVEISKNKLKEMLIKLKDLRDVQVEKI